jgi:hypothetical protein
MRASSSLQLDHRLIGPVLRLLALAFQLVSPPGERVLAGLLLLNPGRRSVDLSGQAGDFRL